MATKSRQLAKRKPEWLQKMEAENVEAANQAFIAFCEFVGAKLNFEATIDEINARYGSRFEIDDIFNISEEQEQAALDILEGDDDDDDN